MSPKFKRNHVGSVQGYGEELNNEAAIPMPSPSNSETETAQSSELLFKPELEFKPKEEKSPLEESTSADFYGSFGAIANDVKQPANEPEPELQDFKPVFSTDVKTELDDDDFELRFNAMMDQREKEEKPIVFSPVSNDTDDDDDLVIPSFVTNQGDYAEKKSMSYDVTTKISTTSASLQKKKAVREIIPENIKEMVRVPKVVQPKAVASGSVTSRDDLPKLREGEMYVALNRRQLRRLTSRSFRGLGVLCTMAMVIIAMFCIWSYVNSFADPIVGRWKGNVASQDIPIAELQNIGQERFDSTWEFNDGGSMYLNLVMNETPVSLSGSYVEKTDEKGSQYIELTLTNPMDGGKYEFSMYYTVTGQVLELNDMQGMGMTITLEKE